MKDATRASARMISKLPKWLGCEDVIFLAAITVPEFNLLVADLEESDPASLYEEKNAMGRIYKITREIALRHFNLRETGMMDKLSDMAWRMLLREESDEYLIALTAVSNKETLSRAKMLRTLSDAKRIDIQNEKAQEELVSAFDARRVYSDFCAEAVRVLDEIPVTLPAKLAGADEEQIDEVLIDFTEKAKKRLKEIKFS